jgi:hypothetical protein
VKPLFVNTITTGAPSERAAAVVAAAMASSVVT